MNGNTKKSKAKSAARRADRMADLNMLDHWKSLAVAAEASRLSDAELVELATDARLGDERAENQLIKGTQYLVFEKAFEWAGRSSKRRIEDIFGALTCGHAEAVGDLLGNQRSDVSKAVADELVRSIRTFGREESTTIFVKDSTKSNRKKKGQPPYFNLTRKSGCLADVFIEGETTVLPDDPKHKGPFTDQTKRRYVPPSKYHNYHDEFALIDLLDEFEDKWLQQVARLMFEEKTQEEIAEITGRTLYAVAQAEAKIEATLLPHWDMQKGATREDIDQNSALLPSTLPPNVADPAVPTAEMELTLSV